MPTDANTRAARTAPARPRDVPALVGVKAGVDADAALRTSEGPVAGSAYDTPRTVAMDPAGSERSPGAAGTRIAIGLSVALRGVAPTTAGVPSKGVSPPTGKLVRGASGPLPEPNGASAAAISVAD